MQNKILFVNPRTKKVLWGIPQETNFKKVDYYITNGNIRGCYFPFPNKNKNEKLIYFPLLVKANWEIDNDSPIICLGWNKKKYTILFVNIVTAIKMVMNPKCTPSILKLQPCSLVYYRKEHGKLTKKKFPYLIGKQKVNTKTINHGLLLPVKCGNLDISGEDFLSQTCMEKKLNFFFSQEIGHYLYEDDAGLYRPYKNKITRKDIYKGGRHLFLPHGWETDGDGLFWKESNKLEIVLEKEYNSKFIKCEISSEILSCLQDNIFLMKKQFGKKWLEQAIKIKK